MQLRQKLRLDIRVFCYSVYSTEKTLGAVHAKIEHLLKESNIRNAGYFVFANTSVLLCWKHYMFMGRKCLQNELTWISYVTFIQNFCIVDCADLSVNRVNDIRETSNFSSQLRVELHCASPIPYHVFISCDSNTSFLNSLTDNKGKTILSRSARDN